LFTNHDNLDYSSEITSRILTKVNFIKEIVKNSRYFARLSLLRFDGFSIYERTGHGAKRLSGALPEDQLVLFRSSFFAFLVKLRLSSRNSYRDIAGNFSYCYFPRSLFIIACASRSDRNSSANCFFNEAMTQSRTACVCAGISSQFSSNSVSNNSLITIGLLGGKLWLSMRRITILLSSCFVIFHLFNVRIEHIKKNQEVDYNKSDLLTNPAAQAYAAYLVLNTPPSADSPAPDSRGFFTPIVCLWPGSEQQYNTRKGNIAGRLTAVFKYLAAPLNRERILNITVRRPSMAAKSISASARRKSISRSAATYLTPELRSQKARSKAIKELHDFLDYASEAEKRVVGHLKVGNCPVSLMKEIRRLLDESIKQCKVIQFPAVKNNLHQSVMEA